MEPALSASTADELALKVEGLKPYTGGEELRRAVAALAGPNPAQQQEVRPAPSFGAASLHAPQPMSCKTKPDMQSLISLKQKDGSSAEPSPAAPGRAGGAKGALPTAGAGAPPHAALIPISVASLDHSTRELALAAQRYEKATRRDACDFDAVYNHGLALQELASRITASRTEQLRLLSQVLCV